MFFSKAKYEAEVKEWLDEPRQVWLREILNEIGIARVPRVSINFDDDLVEITISDSDGSKMRRLHEMLGGRLPANLQGRLSIISRPPIPGERSVSWTVKFSIRWT